MLDFQQKRKVKAVAYHKITLIILGVLVLLFLRSTWSVYEKKQESEKLRNITEANVIELSTRNQDLETKIDRFQTEIGVEEEIRSKFNVAKPGENIVVVVPQENSTSSAKSNNSFWQKVKNFFKN